jgi:hypothetical protein
VHGARETHLTRISHHHPSVNCVLKYPDGKNKILLKAEAQTKLTKKQRKLAATIVLESILGEETLLDCVDDYQLVKELELRLNKMLRPIRRLRDAVRGVSKAN